MLLKARPFRTDRSQPIARKVLTYKALRYKLIGVNDKKNDNDTNIVATILFHVGVLFFVILPVASVIL